jgi:riboflavin synthase
MFTGIIEEIGTVSRLDRVANGARIVIEASQVIKESKSGDSIAVNGTCLTIVNYDAKTFSADIAPESLARTNLGALRRGYRVNLERAVTPMSRMGGHFVQGHVDGTATLVRIDHSADDVRVRVDASKALLEGIVPKGFVALDGVSLTVVDVFPDAFTVMLVPYTRTHITLPLQSVGYRVNVELDMLGKYVARVLERRFPHDGIDPERVSSSAITESFLADNGYQ